MSTPARPTPVSLVGVIDRDAPARQGMIDLNAPESLPAYVRRLWTMRDFVTTLPAASLHGQLNTHRLGRLWLLLNPLLYSLVYYGVFGVLFDTQRNVDNFPGFLVVGVFAYRFTQRSVMASLQTVHRNRDLMQTVSFPRAALPIAAVLGELLVHLPGLLVMALIATVTGVGPNSAWLLIVPATIVQMAFNLGLALLVSRATFQVRDLQQVAPHVLRVLLYVSGVLYPAELVARRVGTTAMAVFEANPVWLLIQLYRQPLLGDPIDGGTWLWATGWAVLTLGVGFVWFRRRERSYADG
jgi:teichoic acid transport system permease protein